MVRRIYVDILLLQAQSGDVIKEVCLISNKSCAWTMVESPSQTVPLTCSNRYLRENHHGITWYTGGWVTTSISLRRTESVHIHSGLPVRGICEGCGEGSASLRQIGRAERTCEEPRKTTKDGLDDEKLNTSTSPCYIHERMVGKACAKKQLLRQYHLSS